MKIDIPHFELPPEVKASIVQSQQVISSVALSGLNQLQVGVGETFVKAFQDVLKGTSEFSSLMQQLSDTVKTISFAAYIPQEAFDELRKTLSSLAINFPVPQLSEDHKKRIIDSYELWGSYGWTQIPCKEADWLYRKAPKGRADADKIALSFCKRPDFIFDAIRSDRRTKKSTFNEAVSTFENKEYTACAMLLFSLIDAQLIRFQKKTQSNSKRRAVGKSAVALAEARVDYKSKPDAFFSMMFFINLFSCLYAVFAGGDDFKVQPEIINRNFLAHGMMHRKVSRKSCIQLFLLYYNMLDMLDMEYSRPA